MYWIVFCKSDLLLTSTGQLPEGETPPVKVEAWHHIINLQLSDSVPVKALMTDAPVCEVGYQMVSLRQSFEKLPAAHYDIAGKAYELLFWDTNTRYCGVCGSPTRWDTEISKRCTSCKKEFWPSPAPAIIVRITREVTDPDTGETFEEVLLVRARNFRGDYYGLVAGFVETGEDLEACVVREVHEETGLNIKNLRYFASQSWPYPFGLMLGFTAEYESGTLHIQKEELSLGGWFARDRLPNIPGKVSLARRLLDDWIGDYSSEKSFIVSR